MEQVKRRVKVQGLCPIMFDRYPGQNSEQLPPEQKLYISKADKKTVVFPSLNITSFLSSINNESAPKRCLGKSWKQTATAALSFVSISPIEIPFTANGKTIKLGNPQIEILEHVARMKKGMLCIPNPKIRPIINLPWELEFDLILFPTPDLTENILRKLFDEGGINLGFGTYRGAYGKFQVDKWE